MRAILKKFRDTTRQGRRCVRSARATLAYLYREERNRNDVLAVEGRFPAGVVTGEAELDALALSGRAPGGKNEVAHFVIAAEEKAVEREKLLRVGHDLGKHLACAGRGYVVVVHRGHVHVAIENYGSDGRALHLTARDMHRLRSLQFTKEFEANQLRGRHPGASSVHPEAKRLAARGIALRLVDGQTTWEELLRRKEIIPARIDREGRVTSFLCRDEKGRETRVRVATVEKIAQRERLKRAERSAAVVARNAGRGLFAMMEDLADSVGQVEQAAQSPGRSR